MLMIFFLSQFIDLIHQLWTFFLVDCRPMLHLSLFAVHYHFHHLLLLLSPLVKMLWFLLQAFWKYFRSIKISKFLFDLLLDFLLHFSAFWSFSEMSWLHFIVLSHLLSNFAETIVPFGLFKLLEKLLLLLLVLWFFPSISIWINNIIWRFLFEFLQKLTDLFDFLFVLFILFIFFLLLLLKLFV
jgi:hypothetical protein